MLIDAHAHLDRFDLVGEEALDVALAEIDAGPILTFGNSMDLASYRRNLEIAGPCRWVLPLFGVHPWSAGPYADRLHDLDEAMAHSPMLGEIGLDHFFVEDPGEYPAQEAVFDCQLAAAEEQQKIVQIHTKGAEAEVLERLGRYRLPAVVIHWYSGPLDLLEELIGREAYFTVGPEVRYSAHVQAIARRIPADRLLTETDNPGGPRSFLGHPGTPRLIEDVVADVARVRGTSTEEIVRTVEGNVARLMETTEATKPFQRLLQT